MNGTLKAVIIVVCTVVVIAITSYIGYQFHIKAVIYPILFMIEGLLTFAGLVIHYKTDAFGGVFKMGVVVILLTLAVWTGFELNFPPPKYEFSYCKVFWTVTRLSETGCEAEDFYAIVNQLRPVGGINYNPRLREALSRDLDEMFRAERDGVVVQSFPRFRQMWEVYNGALINEDPDRFIMSPELYADTRSSIFMILFLGFVVSGLTAFAHLKIVGVGQVVAALIAIYYGNQQLGVPTGISFVPGFDTLSTLQYFRQMGVIFGIIPMVLPIVAQIGSSLVKSKGNGWWILISILATAGFEALAMFMDPRMSQILMMPTINAIILADPNLTMAMVVWSLTLGLITGMGYFTFLEGAINFAKSGFKMP